MSNHEPEPEWLSEIDSEDDSPSDSEQLWRLVDAGSHRAVAQVLRDLSGRVAFLEGAATALREDFIAKRDNTTAGPAVVCITCGHRHPLSAGPGCEVCGSKVAP